MQGKKRYLVVALFLLIGLTTFSFAAPKEELKEKKTIKGTSEKIANDKKVNNSYTDALEAVEEAGWKLLAHTFDLHHDESMNEGNVMTEYEEKFSSMGNPIHKLIATRK